MSNLNGKFAIVTGGAKGIGAAIVRRFAIEGASGIAILDYDIDAAKALAAKYTDGNVIALKCDISNRENVCECIKQVYDQFGWIDILVNNAGICRDAIFTKMNDETWRKVLDTNLNGTYNCLKEVVPIMVNQGYGKIVNISSSSAHGNIGQTNYSASKAAILGLTKSLARELAAKGITVNAVSPCFIETEMMAGIPDELTNAMLRLIPMHRRGTPDELASAVYFLSTDDSRFITGIELPVNGGMYT